MSKAWRLPARRSKVNAGLPIARSFCHSHSWPFWTGGKRGAPQILANCYRNSLQLAVKNRIRTIAFPAISCGAYGYPIREAARIAVDTTREFLATDAEIDKVTFVVASDEILAAYRLHSRPTVIDRRR
jgi:O-acetyl-ADP-ribose deacetylase (regulator of RNase III)